MIVSVVCLVLRPSLLPDSAALIIGILIWAGVAAACALVLLALSRANDFWETLLRCGDRCALVLAGAYLLFFNDQGQELGVSLMIDDHGYHGFVFLSSH